MNRKDKALEIDEKLIKRLAKLLEQTGLTEIEYEVEQQRIRVSALGMQMRGMSVQNVPANAAPTPVANAPTPLPSSPVPSVGQLTSPMVGTAYLASEPGQAPFVKVGDRVAKGQTVLIIEAMKVMNPIAAPQAGTISAILISDGQPVEFGEPLVVIE
ncbi:MAG TPA: acetyl-CoA carboxylase biotin carboxyl carrier protein [Dongiaceae bacterium]|jgi:acetyl-CoA carboxylase biotin carboxyl carrier protein|nr:acetyl-CoA carboxylase biotin carboxyl carrier protein [Dongiaceae bacterium]